MNSVADHSVLSMLSGSGPVVLSVLIVLVVLSVLSWTITIAKILQYSRAQKDTAEFSKLFWDTKNFTKVGEACESLSASPLAQVFSTGYRELSSLIAEDESGNKDLVAHDKKSKLAVLDSALERAQFEESLRLEKGLTFLASVASAAPFIGLFGTVWGIMNAFHGLSSAQSTTIQAVAPGISEALIATAVGLAAAIPAAVAYNYFAVAVKNFREAMVKFSSEFVSIAQRYFVK